MINQKPKSVPIFFCFRWIAFLVLSVTVRGQEGFFQAIPIIEKVHESPLWVMTDSLVQYLRIPETNPLVIAMQDSVTARQVFLAGYQHFQNYRESNDFEELRLAKSFFEKAFIRHRQNPQYQRALHGVYRLLEKWHHDANRFREAALLGERLKRLNEETRNDYGIHFNLGNHYFEAGELTFALLNFKKAEKLLNDQWIQVQRKGDPGTVQKLEQALFNTLFRIHQVYSEQDLPQKALVALNRAAGYAQNPGYENVITSRIRYIRRWIYWGSRRSVDLEVAIQNQMNQNSPGKADSLYAVFEGLYSSLSDFRRLDVALRYSLFDFQHTSQKGRALRRLLPWITGDKPVNPPLDGYDNMVENFCRMCYLAGLDFLEQDRFSAYCYFLQGYGLESGVKVRIGLELLKLSLNQASEAVRIGEELWERRENLNDAEKKWVCSMMIQALRRLNKPDEARRYFTVYQSFFKSSAE